jgi:hypothetical protein
MAMKKLSGKSSGNAEPRNGSQWFRDAAVVANTQLTVDKKRAQEIARRTVEAIKRSAARQG